MNSTGWTPSRGPGAIVVPYTTAITAMKPAPRTVARSRDRRRDARAAGESSRSPDSTGGFGVPLHRARATPASTIAVRNAIATGVKELRPPDQNVAQQA